MISRGISPPIPRLIDIRKAWPENHVVGLENEPVPFHLGQQWAIESKRRYTAMIAGTQGGKTGFGPWWLKREIERHGSGDYYAITATFDLFKLKMLPSILHVFEEILGIGRYWAGDKILELRDPHENRFWANRSSDRMWGRIILRSADSEGSLESGTVKAAWLDEAGQPRFGKGAWKAIKRRISLHRGLCLITTTLYDLGWVKEEFIDKVENDAEHTKTLHVMENGAELERTDSARVNTCLIQFDSIVNPVYSVEEFEEAQQDSAEDEFNLFWRGRVVKPRHLIYDSFYKTRHTCPRIPIPREWKRYWGMDYGDVHLAVMFYAEEPGTGRLYCYREYLDGGLSCKDHYEAIMKGERGLPHVAAGGVPSEGQWRREFADAGLPVVCPPITDVGVGINRVYACHANDEIIYFDDLKGIIKEKQTYQKKRDRTGKILDEIKDKSKFHRLDAERYIIATIRDKGGWSARY